MKFVVQQTATGLFLKRSAVWVRSPDKAREFANAAAAINYSIALGIRDVQLAVFSDEWELEGCLWPFGAPDLREESRGLQKKNRKLREQQEKLKAELDDILAGSKERNKQISFVPRNIQKQPKE